MTSKLKTLGLATAAVLAISTVVASAVQAQFTANDYPTAITGSSSSGNEVFTVDGSSANCAGHFAGTFAGSSTSLTVTPNYTHCTGVFGFATGTFTENGCDYVFHSNGILDLACPSGNKMVIVAGNCEVQIGSQTGLRILDLDNHHPAIDMFFSVSGITVNVTKDGFLCPLNGTGHKSGTYVEAMAVHLAAVSGGTTVSVH